MSADEFEALILEVARIIREERERGKIDVEGVVDNRLIRLPMRGRAVFVGDIHGELESLNEILRHTNFASKKPNSEDRGYIIFLGDFVDRGPNSIEVLTTLFSLKIQFKDNVVLLKGNHESPNVNSRYGFMDEVATKYPRESKEIYTVCNRLFEKLPHAVVTANGIFAAHGGIPENVSTLRQIADLKNELLEQLLWNDPRPKIHGFVHNYGRDPLGLTGIRYFGEDVAESFLKGIGAEIFVRAHEYYGGAGYMTLSNRVLTIFSAKYGRSDWKRAYIDTDLSRKIKDVNSLIPDIRIL